MDDCVAVQAECRRALLAHVYAVSAEMPPDDGARYLKMMTARIVEPGLSHQVVISQSSK
jgi:3-methyladenine DNA glycosylase Tag